MAKQTVEQSFFHTYHRLPVEIDRGEGMYLYATDGTRYLDMFAGIAVNALGHSHPDVLRQITRQASRYLHLSNYFLQGPQAELAELLLGVSGYQRVFFTNSGTEAVEGALKIARKYGSTRGRKEVIAFSNSFHGRTMGSLSLMDRPLHRDGFGPFLDGCSVLPFDDAGALESRVGPTTAAVILEFIQGEGGIHPVSVSTIEAIERLRREHDLLLIADEVQCGLGRTGTVFAFEAYGATPDIVLTAKPLGGGLPLGAILGNERVAGVLAPGTHGSTFGGNAVACAAGTVLLRHLREGSLLQNVRDRGDQLLRELRILQQKHPESIVDIRGRGLMIGVEFSFDASGVVHGLLQRKVLANATAGNVLRIVPPLVIEPVHVEEFITALGAVLGRREV